MAQKVNPLAVRLGVNRGADSSWFSDYYYATLLSQDLHLREYLLTVTNGAAGRPPLDLKPGRCVIHHYPKISFVHLCVCRLFKNTKRPRSVVTKRKPLYSYESILPSFKHPTAPRANALRRVYAPEASGAFAPPAGQQQTGEAKASGLRASTTRGTKSHPVFKHTFVKHILAEVLLAEPGKDGWLKQDDTPPGLSSLWLDDIAMPRNTRAANIAPSLRRALNLLSQGLGNLRKDHPSPPPPGLLNKARPLQTTTQYGPPEGPVVALGLKLAKLVEARLHEVRCALALNKALQTTTPCKCAVVNQRCKGFSIAPCRRLRHKDTPGRLRAVQLAGSLLKKRQTRPSALRFVVSSASGGTLINQTGAAAKGGELTTTSLLVPAPSTLCLDLLSGTRCLWWPESRLALRRISRLCLLKGTNHLARKRTTRTEVAFYEQPPRLLGLFQKASPQAITRTTFKVDKRAKPPEGSVPLAAREPLGSRPLTPLVRPLPFRSHLARVCQTEAAKWFKQLDTMGDLPSGLKNNTCANSSAALLGGLLLEEAEEDDRVTPEPLWVSDFKQPVFQTSTSAQSSSGLAASTNARVAQPNGGPGLTLQRSVWRPLVYTVHNRLTHNLGPAVSPNPIGPMSDTPLGLLTQALTSRMSGISQTSDLHDEADLAVRQHRNRNLLCSQREPCLATLTPEASAHKLCSTTGTKCQMLKFKGQLKPFLLESVPHFPKLLRLSGWTRLAMHQAQGWPMRHQRDWYAFVSKALRQFASTQAPGDLPPEPVVRLNKKKAPVVVSRLPKDRLKDAKRALALKGSKAGASLGTPRPGIDTAQVRLSQSTTKAGHCTKVEPLCSTQPSWTLKALKKVIPHSAVPSPSRKGLNANKHHQAFVTPAKRRNGRATRVFAVSADKKTKGWLTHSCLNYYVMHYFSLCKTNRYCGDVNGHVQHVQRHVTEAHYLELPLNQSSHYLLSNIQSRIESHTGTFTSILPIKLTSVVYQTASLVAQDISLKLEQKKAFRQICRSIFKRMGLCKYIIKGIRIKCSGRLNGAEIAKTECRKYGETSLHVFSEKIDYAHTKASTPYGILGVKVWIAYV